MIFGVKTAELIGDDFEHGVGLVERDPGFQPAGDEEVVAEVGTVGIDLEGYPEISRWIGGEGLAQYANNRIRLVAERNSAPHNVGIAAKFALPEPVVEHHNMAAVGTVLLRREGAAKQNRRAKKAEVCL